LATIWYKNCFWVILPENLEPVSIKDRSQFGKI
jgi:hypothetical protein